MSNDNNNLRFRINPSVLTAGSSLKCCAVMGDTDAAKLYGALKEYLPAGEAVSVTDSSDIEKLRRLTMLLAKAVRVRHDLTDKVFSALKMSAIVDLGCGYNHRGISVSKMRDVKYYGIDLPEIIGNMQNAVGSVILMQHLVNRINYIVADVTDYNSLRACIKGREPLFIVTDDLMMYLTDQEAGEVMTVIQKLLSEFGGVWVTGDADSEERVRIITDAALDEDERGILGELKNSFYDSSVGVVFKNRFMTLKGAERTEYIESFGFSCGELPIHDFSQLGDLPENVREAYGKTKYLFMTPKGERVRGSEIKKSTFSVDSTIENGELLISVNGRADAANAPKIIDEFNLRSGTGYFSKVILDLADCVYLSSGGVRAVLILRKSSDFEIRNIRPEVYEVLLTIGMVDYI